MAGLRQQLYAHTPPYLLLRGLYLARRLRGRLERETVEIARFVRARSTAVDVGAYDGLYSFEFARHGVKATHAFEPHPIAAERLTRAKLPRTMVHGVALSDTSGVAELVVPEGQYGRALSHLAQPTKTEPDAQRVQRYKVPTKPLDSYDLDNVSFVKIDVEGHELSVLEGARATLQRSRPTMLIEVEQRHHAEPVAEVLHAIESFGYKGSFLDWPSARWRPVREFDPEIHQVIPTERALTLDDRYINNFLFRSI